MTTYKWFFHFFFFRKSCITLVNMWSWKKEKYWQKRSRYRPPASWKPFIGPCSPRRMKNTSFCPRIYYTNLYLTLTRSWWFLLQLSGDVCGLRSDPRILKSLSSGVTGGSEYARSPQREEEKWTDPLRTYGNTENRIQIISLTWCHHQNVNTFFKRGHFKLWINTRHWIRWRCDIISYNGYCESGSKHDRISWNEYVSNYWHCKWSFCGVKDLLVKAYYSSTNNP